MDNLSRKEDFLSTTAGFLTGAVISNLLWGSASPCIKLGYRLFQVESSDVMSQILFAGIRFFLAGILTILLGSLMRRRFLVPKRTSGSMLAALALTQTVIQYTFFYMGLSVAPGYKGSIISPTSTFFALLIASLIFHQETLTWKKILGCLIGFAGVIVINSGSSSGVAGFRLTGEGFLILAAASYGCSSVLIKRFSSREDPVVLSGYQFVLGGAVMLLTGLVFGGKLRPVGISAWLLMGYLGLLSAVAYTVWSLLLQRHPVSKVTVSAFLNPIFGVVLSALILGEGKILNIPRCLLAIVLVSLGVWIVNRPETAKQS